jgi:plastocyanin
MSIAAHHRITGRPVAMHLQRGCHVGDRGIAVSSAILRASPFARRASAHMPTRLSRLAPAAVGALALALAACGGGGASPATSASASPAAPSESAAPASPSDAAAEADITVTGVDFAFEDMPDSVSAGTTLGFTNAGQEVHEMAVFRKNDDVTQSFDELLALPGEEALAFVTPIGTAFSEPGEAATDVVALEQAGEYIMVCFVAAGTTEIPSEDPNASPDQEVPTGAPHFTLGMVQTFTVTE